LFRQERLKFWSDPDTELKLAKETGISVFRMGIDWTRVMPKEPTDAEFKSSHLSGIDGSFKGFMNME